MPSASATREAGRGLDGGSSRGYVGKLRPVVIVQDDRPDATDSATVCAFTTDSTEAPLIRPVIEPDDPSVLPERSSLMVVKIVTVSRSRLGQRIGRLREEEVIRLGQAAMGYSGLAARRTRSWG